MAEKILYEIQVDANFADLIKLQTEMDKLSKEQSELAKNGQKNTETYQKNKIALKELGAEHRATSSQAKIQGVSVKSLGNSYNNLTAENRRLSQELRNIQDPLGKGKVQFDKLSKAIDLNTDRLKTMDSAMGRSNRHVGNYARGLGGATKSMVTSGIGAMGLAGGISGVMNVLGGAVQIFKDFEQGNSNLASVIGTTKDNVVALSEDAKRLGASTSFSAVQVTELQTEFAKLGFKEDQILSATEATLNLAAATGTDLANAASVAGGTLGGFGLDASETERLTDVMAKSFSTSALDISKFSESMKAVAPAAKAVGVDVETTTALLGTLANAGVSGSLAGNALKNVFINLNTAGLTMEEGFTKVNNSSDKLGTAVALVGKEAAASFLILAEGKDSTLALEEGLRDAGGAAEEMAKTQLNNLAGSMTILNSAWEGFILNLEDGNGALSGLVRGIVDATTSFLNFITVQEKSKEQTYANMEANYDLVKSSEALLNEYEALNIDGLEPTKENKARLTEITYELKDSLGESVVSINKETGALELNTAAVKEQIRVKRFQMDTEATTIASRLKGVKDDISSILLRKKALESEAKILKDIATKNKAFSKQAQDAVNASFSKSGIQRSTLTEEQSKSIERYNSAQRELLDINKDLKDLEKERLDFVAKLKALHYTEAEANAIFIETKKETIDITEDEIELQEEHNGLIEKQQKIVSDLQKQISKLRSESSIAKINIDLNFEEKELKRLQDLGKYVDIVLIKPRTIEDVAKNLKTEIESQEIKLLINPEIAPTSEEDGLDRHIWSDEEKEALRQAEIDLAQETSDAVFKVAQEANNRKLKYELDQLSIQSDLENDLLKSKLDRGLITQEEYENNRIALAERTAEQEEKIKRKAFEDNKKLQIAQAIANGALAVTAIMTVPDFTLGVISAIRIGAALATTAVQVATIASQKYARGGYIRGKSHAQGGVHIEAEDGEVVINKNSVQKFGKELDYINRAGGGVPLFERGGYVRKFAQGGLITSNGMSDMDLAKQSEMISATINNLRVINVASDTVSKYNQTIRIENEFTL